MWCKRREKNAVKAVACVANSIADNSAEGVMSVAGGAVMNATGELLGEGAAKALGSMAKTVVKNATDKTAIASTTSMTKKILKSENKTAVSISTKVARNKAKKTIANAKSVPQKAYNIVTSDYNPVPEVVCAQTVKYLCDEERDKHKQNNQ